MSETGHSLAATLDRAWAMLAAGVADRTAPARHPVLATVGRGGGAEARVVVLRGADRIKATPRTKMSTTSQLGWPSPAIQSAHKVGHSNSQMPMGRSSRISRA